jgi:hypothetical protein
MSTNTGDAKVKLTLDTEEAKRRLGEMRQEVDRNRVADKKNPASPSQVGPGHKSAQQRLTPQDVERIKGLNELSAHRRAADKKDAEWQARRSRIAESAQRVSGEAFKGGTAFKGDVLRGVAEVVRHPIKSTAELATSTLGPVAGELAAIGSAGVIGYGIARSIAMAAPLGLAFLSGGATEGIGGVINKGADLLQRGFDEFEAGLSGIVTGASRAGSAIKAQSLATGEADGRNFFSYYDMFSKYEQETVSFNNYIDRRINNELAGKIGRAWGDFVYDSFKQMLPR